MNTYFSRELVEQVNSRMTSRRVSSRVISPQVRSYVERKTTQELSDALSFAWRKNAVSR